MRRVLTLIAAWLWLMPVGIASAAMTLQDYHAQNHDRFYVGGDKAFIGDPYDWSGVGRGSLWATMVSDQYFLSANHSHPAVGGTTDFYWTNSPSGSFETGTVESGTQIGGSDLWLGKLKEPVTANVAKYSILSLPPASYDNLVLYTFGLSNSSEPTQNMRLGRNNIDPGSIQQKTIDLTTGEVYLFDFDNPGGLGAHESYLQPFDSGGPSFAVIGDEPALVGIHWFTWEDKSISAKAVGSGDTLVPYYIAAINAAMLSGGEQLTLVPEPSTLALWSLFGMVGGFVAWRKRRRSTPWSR